MTDRLYRKLHAEKGVDCIDCYESTISSRLRRSMRPWQSMTVAMNKTFWAILLSPSLGLPLLPSFCMPKGPGSEKTRGAGAKRRERKLISITRMRPLCYGTSLEGTSRRTKSLTWNTFKISKLAWRAWCMKQKDCTRPALVDDASSRRWMKHELVASTRLNKVSLYPTISNLFILGNRWGDTLDPLSMSDVWKIWLDK